jgi:peptide/nickel transport system substrate-binding protein
MPAPSPVRRLPLLAAAAAAATLLAACSSGTSSGSAPSSGSTADSGSTAGSGSGSASTAATGTPVKGGSVTVGLETAPDSLDPNVASSADDSLVMRQIFDSLVEETTSHQFEPWLATSWKISSNGLHYTFQLRKGVSFQDGTPFNAAAVTYNIERILNPKTASQYAISLLGSVTDAVVAGPYTVRLDLKTPDADLMEGLSEAFLGIESPTAIKKYGSNAGEHPVGTGPFSFVSETAGQQVVLAANAKYDSPPSGASHSGAPYLSKLTFEVVPDNTARVGGLQSGQLDAIEGVPAEQIAAMKASSSQSIQVLSSPGASYAFYPNEKVAPWNNVTAREALRSAIDVNAIIKTLYFGQYPRAWSVLSPTTQGYDASLANSYSYDPSEARKELESLGYTMGSDGYLQKDGKDLTLLMVNNSPDFDKRFEIDTIVQQELQAAGIKENLSDVAFAQYASATENGKYGMESFSVTAGTASILDTIFNSANEPTPTDFLYDVANYASSQMDSLGAQAAAASSTTARDALYEKMQQLVFSQAIAIPIYVPVVTFAQTTSLHGVTFDPREYADFYSAWK